MKLIDKIRKETPLKDKIDGIFCTKIGIICATVLATGLVVFSGKAVYHAKKTV